MMEAGGIDPSLRFAVDYDLFLKMMALPGGRFLRQDAYLGAFREHDASKTATENATIGQPEVAALQQRHGVRRYPFDRILGGLLRRQVEWRSASVFTEPLTGLLQRRVGDTLRGPC